MRILLEFERHSVAGSKAALVTLEQIDESVSYFPCQSFWSYRSILARRRHAEIGTEGLAEAYQRFEKQIRRGKPHWASPV